MFALLESGYRFRCMLAVQAPELHKTKQHRMNELRTFSIKHCATKTIAVYHIEIENQHSRFVVVGMCVCVSMRVVWA